MARRPTSLARQRQRLTLALTIALCALLAAIGYITYQDHLNAQFSQPTAVEVKAISIYRPGFAVIELLQQDDGWRITAPIETAANSQRLEPLLQMPNSDGNSYALNEVDLAELGLAEPAAVIQFDGREIALGDKDVSGEQRYARDGERVRLVPEWMLSLINGGLTALAELAVFPTAIEQLEWQAIDNSERALDAAKWHALSAQQLVLWPLPADTVVNDAPIMRGSLQARHADKVTQEFVVWQTSRFVALVPSNKNFAYLIAVDQLPEAL